MKRTSKQTQARRTIVLTQERFLFVGRAKEKRPRTLVRGFLVLTCQILLNLVI